MSFKATTAGANFLKKLTKRQRKSNKNSKQVAVAEDQQIQERQQLLVQEELETAPQPIEKREVEACAARVREQPSQDHKVEVPTNEGASETGRSYVTVHSQQSSRALQSTPVSCHLLVDQIFSTVAELEYSLLEEHQNDFALRMALEKQSERVQDLNASLEVEKKRNERLVQLIQAVDSTSSTEDEAEFMYGGLQRSALDTFESISPLLMQQRYEELSVSYKQCHHQLAKKEHMLKLSKCEKEELQSKYDYLFDEFRSGQKRFEDLCYRYLKLQAKKNYEIERLREALSFASDCVISAQKIIGHFQGADAECERKFNQNLQLFIKALRHCEWIQGKCSVSEATASF